MDSVSHLFNGFKDLRVSFFFFFFFKEAANKSHSLACEQHFKNDLIISVLFCGFQVFSLYIQLLVTTDS